MISIKTFFKVIALTIFIVACASDDDSNGNRNPRILNLQSTGNSANELLSSKTHNKLILELVAVKGFEPKKEAVENLVNFIEKRTFKSNGVQVIQRSIASTNKKKLSIKQIDSIEQKNRTQLSTPNQHAIFIYFSDADANPENSEGEMNNDNDSMSSLVLGSAYRNTSMVVYENTLKKIVNQSNSVIPDEVLARVETFTLQHEFCHLLGLVNLGTRMQTPHEDTDENGKPNKHCNVRGCLMQANALFESNLMGNIKALELDPLCVKDLQANGGR
ncbi:hypothetical protein [Aquimarina agarilytica]|uniref:hypothetical protein n=1 Tax=Aquimarina agarilytica TaxID=1087449 RepID=UPI0002897A76|nr:hypothetical protein [Aquimarina agarilytica]